MFSRAGRAAILDRKPFTEAYFDGDSAADAAILVALVAAVTYVGTLLINGAIGSFSLEGLFESVIAGVVSWLILGFASWFAATRLFQSTGRPQTFIALQGLAVLPLVLDVRQDRRGDRSDLVPGGPGGRHQGGGHIDTRNAAVSVLIGFAIAAIFRTLLGVPFAVFSALF